MSAVIEEVIEIEPGQNLEFERELREQYHVDFKFHPEVPTTAFDVVKSQHNQARFNAIDQPTVDLYTEAVKRGDIFPAIVAYRPAPRARYVNVDGNHRLCAHIAADNKPVAMYELDKDTDPRTIALLTFSLNTRHGKPTSEEERVHQAIYLVDNGAGIENAAAAVSISSRILKKAMARAKADERADEVGLHRNEWDTLGATVKTRLLKVTTDEGFRAAANLAYQAKLDAEEVGTLVAQLNSTKSGTKQEAIVKANREMHQSRIQGTGGGVLKTASRRVTGPKQRLNMALGQMLALPTDDKAILKAYAMPERADAAKRLRETSARLLSLADILSSSK